MEIKISKRNVIIMILIFLFVVPLLPWKLTEEEPEEINYQPEYLEVEYGEKAVHIEISYLYDELSDLVNLEKTEGIESFVIEQKDDKVSISTDIPYQQLKDYVLAAIHQQQEEIRRVETAAAVGMDLATYPLDVDGIYFKYASLVVQIAKSEPELAENVNGVTKYGLYFNDPTAEWCTEFAVWCNIQAEKQINDDAVNHIIPRNTNSGSEINGFKKRGTFFARGTIVPRMGDFIFFDTNRDGASDHTGMITKVEYNESDGKIYIHTIEGNIPGDRPSTRIRQQVFPADSSIIVGYGTYIVNE